MEEAMNINRIIGGPIDANCYVVTFESYAIILDPCARLDLIKKALGDYKLAFISGSSTAATEATLWSLIGARGVDILQYGVFSKHWANDVVNQLKIKDVRIFESEYWTLGHKDKVDFSRDLVFCWTETTTGV